MYLNEAKKYTIYQMDDIIYIITDDAYLPSHVLFRASVSFPVESSSNSNATLDFDKILDRTKLLKFFTLVCSIEWIIDFLFFFRPSRILALRMWCGLPSEADRFLFLVLWKTSSSSGSMQISGILDSRAVWSLGLTFIPLWLVSFEALIVSSSLYIVTSILGIGTELLRNLVGAERPSPVSVHAIPLSLQHNGTINFYIVLIIEFEIYCTCFCFVLFLFLKYACTLE